MAAAGYTKATIWLQKSVAVDKGASVRSSMRVALPLADVICQRHHALFSMHLTMRADLHAALDDMGAFDTQHDFEKALAAALASGRPTLIDAKISRVDLPHFSENPEGVLASIWDRVTKRNPLRHDIGA